MKLTNQQLLVIGLVVLVVGWYLKSKAGDALDITSKDNLAHSTANKVGSALSGDENFSLGAWWWEVWNPEAVEAELEAAG